MSIHKSNEPTKDGRCYYFRIKYKDIFGKNVGYRSQKYATLKEATLEEAKYKLLVGSKVLTTTSITFEEAYYEFLEHKKAEVKPQTIEKIETLFTHLSPIHKTKISKIDIAVYQRLRKHIDGFGFSVDHSNKIQNLFKQVLLYSKKYYGTNDIVVSYIEPFKNINSFKKEMSFFTYDEYKRFDSVIDNFNYHVFFEMLYYCGLRCGELTALTFKDIDFEKGTININKTCSTKYKGSDWLISTPKTKNSIRVLPIKKSVLNDLKTLKNNAIKYQDYKDTWFVFGFVKPYAESTIAKYKNKYCDLAEVPRIRIHDFRHSFASLMINAGASIVLVSKYLGHSSVSITLDVYSHFYKSELENIIQKIDNL